MPAVSQQTGNGVVNESRRDVQSLLETQLTLGYKAALPMWALYTDSAYMAQVYIRRDIELMMTHPMVRSTLDYYKGGLAGAEIETESDSPEVKDYVEKHVDRYWQTGVPLVQGGYEYGWIGLEPMYEEKDGYFCWDKMIQFSPNDVYPLTQAHELVGVRVKNVSDKGSVDLWNATKDVPAKGLWYAHNPRYNRLYGQSQLLGAWRPWRRLAWKDGAESVVDMGVFRYGIGVPVIRYPEEDLQIEAGAGQLPPGTTYDSEGKPRRYARDLARFVAETLKSGAGVGLPSTKYPNELGGGDKWGVDPLEVKLDVAGLIAYIKYLQDQISFGVGVAPELQTASETGSGYSGRKLPMDAFLMGQQRLANAILELFLDQVLRPLVRWNFGKQATFTCKVKDLLKSTRQAATGATTAENSPDMRPDQVPGPTPPSAQPQAQLSMLNMRARVLAIAEKIRRAA